MNKILLLISSLTLGCFLIGCGMGTGGAGPADTPRGANPNKVTVVQLVPDQYIAQTNGSITLNAKALDGNGRAVQGQRVIFTNLSVVGTLDTLSAVTDDTGIATATLSSTAAGFAVVTAQVNAAAGTVRDKKTVYFSSLDALTVSMDMNIDSVPGNGVYNELNDVTLFQNITDDTADITAVVRNAGGVPLSGEALMWSTDQAEAVIIRHEPFTNVNGQAKAVIQVTPASIRNTVTHVNVMGQAGNGAANMVTLFLNPVVIDASLSAITVSPAIVNIGGTAEVSVVAMLNTGDVVPNGVSINFRATCGTVTSFVQTTGGVAKATFTAPATIPVGNSCTVTASAGGVTIGSVQIAVTTPLVLLPGTMTLNELATGTFTIFGGVAPYNIFSNNGLVPPSVATVAASGGTFTVTPAAAFCTPVAPATTCTGTATITVRDSVGTTATATITISGI